MGNVQSVERAVAILRSLADTEAGVSQLAGTVGLPKSTVSRLLSTLQDLGAVEATDNGYRVGPLIAEIAFGTGQGEGLTALARPYLARLVATYGEDAGLSVLDGGETLYLEQVSSGAAVQLRDWTGERIPPHCVSSGLVLLAHAPAADRARVLAGPLPRLTANTMATPSRLRRRLAAIARRDSEWVYGEFSEDINSVASAVFNGNSTAVAALHIHGPSYRFPGERDPAAIAAAVASRSKTDEREVAAMSEAIRQYIGGRYVDGSSGETFPTINPATGRTLADVQQASADDVDAAVVSSRAAFEEWRELAGAARGRVLMDAVRLLRDRNDELAALEVADTGKPIAEAIAVDVASGADCIEYYAGMAATLHGEHLDFGTAWGYTRREPLGVCAGIGAWNYPLQIACWKSAPALACGNAMVFKPAELTPLTASKLAEIYSEAGVPAGLFNVVHGDHRVGQLLSEHPGIAKVSLTGEVGTGRKVMAQAAGTLKHVTLELGGKSPLIVFADADLDNAVSGALLGNFYTQGEVCSNGTRVFVHRDVKEEFTTRLVERVAKMTIGDPTDPATDVGALISAEHLEKVLGYIEAGRVAGAKIAVGGRRVTDGALGDGYFVEPTVFDGCNDDMSIVRDEIFGPVMTLLEFADEDEVIRRANDTPYGLSAGVFTRDLQRAHRVVRRLEAGTTWINTYNITPIELPFGGVKQSGLGRENGTAAVEHYTQLKSVYVEMGDVESPY